MKSLRKHLTGLQIVFEFFNIIYAIYLIFDKGIFNNGIYNYVFLIKILSNNKYMNK